MQHINKTKQKKNIPAILSNNVSKLTLFRVVASVACASRTELKTTTFSPQCTAVTISSTAASILAEQSNYTHIYELE